ncbi:MAG: zincin-like metallopeptidase domain-containing protein [Deferrisomatales bacterium]
MNVYEILTERILQKLDEGVVPWRKTWRGPEPHQNLVSRRPYRGINVFLLAMQGFGSPYWLTRKQAGAVGGRIRAGEPGSLVVFWKWLDKRDPRTGEALDPVPLLRYYRVWNLEQTDGIERPEPKRSAFPPIKAAEEILRGMPDRPEGGHRDPGRAYYDPWGDRVNLPPPEAFEGPEAYYACAFHELVHSTGHKSRLDRPTLIQITRFGGHAYCKEELVAEMGAAFLCGVAGIEEATLANSAAYIDGWRRKLTDAPRLLVHAAGQAQRAADFVLGRTEAKRSH